MSTPLVEMPTISLPFDYSTSGRLPQLLAQLAQEHGPVFKWAIPEDSPLAGQERVFLVGPEANRFVMHTHREAFSHDRGWTPVLGEMFGRGLLNMDDPDHARHRKMWNPAFTSAYMEAYLPVIQQVIAGRTADWAAQESVDVYAEARAITFDIAAAALGGFEIGERVDRLRHLFYTMLYGGQDAQTYEEYMAEVVPAYQELVGTLVAEIAARRAAPADEAPRDVLGFIVRARDENGDALSDEQVLGHLNILLVAGHETTTSLVAWMLYLLATLPDQRARLEAELDAALGDSTAPISVEALRGLKQLDYFIRETGRLYPPVFLVPRGVVRDVEFGGYRLPEGTIVRLGLAATHHLPQVFADPERFDPDRFAPPREEDKRTPYGLVTFGGGTRLCIGINFANVEARAVAAHVLRQYTWEPADARRPQQAGFFNTTIPGGIRLRFRPRG